MKGLIGIKLGNTQVFDGEGNLVPVTVVQAGPCTVLEKREPGKDGYEAVQLGFKEVEEKKVSKPVMGQFKKREMKPMRHLKEFRGLTIENLEIGQVLDVDVFKAGDLVDVCGTSKGKGFAGTMKRHNFGGGPNTHGSMSHRRPASGGGTEYNRTIKGKKNPGHLGAVTVTARGLSVVVVDKDNHLLLIKGAVPGSKKSLVTIRESKKAPKGG